MKCFHSCSVFSLMIYFVRAEFDGPNSEIGIHWARISKYPLESISINQINQYFIKNMYHPGARKLIQNTNAKTIKNKMIIPNNNIELE